VSQTKYCFPPKDKKFDPPKFLLPQKLGLAMPLVGMTSRVKGLLTSHIKSFHQFFKPLKYGQT